MVRKDKEHVSVCFDIMKLLIVSCGYLPNSPFQGTRHDDLFRLFETKMNNRVDRLSEGQIHYCRFAMCWNRDNAEPGICNYITLAILSIIDEKQLFDFVKLLVDNEAVIDPFDCDILICKCCENTWWNELTTINSSGNKFSQELYTIIAISLRMLYTSGADDESSPFLVGSFLEQTMNLLLPKMDITYHRCPGHLGIQTPNGIITASLCGAIKILDYMLSNMTFDINRIFEDLARIYKHIVMSFRPNQNYLKVRIMFSLTARLLCKHLHLKTRAELASILGLFVRNTRKVYLGNHMSTCARDKDTFQDYSVFVYEDICAELQYTHEFKLPPGITIHKNELHSGFTFQCESLKKQCRIAIRRALNIHVEQKFVRLNDLVSQLHTNMYNNGLVGNYLLPDLHQEYIMFGSFEEQCEHKSFVESLQIHAHQVLTHLQYYTARIPKNHLFN
jgi:hypothetical protein